MANDRATRFGLVAAVTLAVVLVSVPGGMDSPFDGAPLSASGRVALSFICCLAATIYFFPLRRPPGRWLVLLLLALVVLKIGVSLLSVPHGWRTTYAFGDSTGKMHNAQFFWHFASRSFRIEPHIRISDSYSNLHFFNDVSLYGYPPYIPTRRDVRFPLVVTWSGHVTATAPRNLVVIASGAGRLTIATSNEIKSWDDASAVRHPLRLAPGPQQITLTYTKPADAAPMIRAELLDEEGKAVVSTTPKPASERQWSGSGVTTAIVLAGLASLFAAVSVGYVRFGTSAVSELVLVRLAAVAATFLLVGWATMLALNMVWRTEDFGAGGDPLGYASFARDILHHGPLMLQGLPIGQAAPFYFYPFYPYLLAAAHALVGEDVSTIFLVNGWFLALLPALFFTLGWQRLPRVAGIIAFSALFTFIYVYTEPFIEFAEPVFTDFPFLPMVFLSLVALAHALAHPTPKQLLLAGAVMALGAATRPSLMTLFYLTPFALWFAMVRPPVTRWAIATAWVAAGVFIGLLPFTIRNLIASGQFVMLVNSWIQIPYFLIPPELVDRPGGIPSLGQAIVMAKDIFLAYPVRTITVEVRKVLYTLGFTDVGPAGFHHARLFVVLTALFCWSIGSRRVRGPLAIALVTFAVSHLAAMVVAAPWTFHYKSILPLHAVFLFTAAFLLDRRGAAAMLEAKRYVTTGIAICAVIAALASVLPPILERLSPRNGLIRSVFPQVAFEGTPVDARTSELNLRFLDEEPTLRRQNFSARWRGFFYVSHEQTVEFFAGGNDKIDMRVDGELLLRRSLGDGMRTIGRRAHLDAGSHEISVEYQQFGGGMALNIQRSLEGHNPAPFSPAELFSERIGSRQVLLLRAARSMRRMRPYVWSGLAVLAIVGFGALNFSTGRKTDAPQSARE